MSLWFEILFVFVLQQKDELWSTSHPVAEKADAFYTNKYFSCIWLYNDIVI